MGPEELEEGDLLMIDWDEIDWKRGIATLFLGLLIIAGGIFVLNDYLAFKGTKVNLDQNLADITAYAQKYPPAAAQDSSQLEAQIKDLEAQIAASKVKLADSYDQTAVQAEIESRAKLQGVNLISVEPRNPITHGFLIYHPLDVTFGGTRDQITEFLRGLDLLPFQHEIEKSPVSFSDKITITLNVIVFDRDSWLVANPCPEVIPVPALREVNVQSVRLFKGNLEQEQAQIEAKVGELQKAVSLSKQSCDVNHRLGLAQFKLQALKSP
jgi:Tfp pilus assembly protein PilO